MLDRCCLAPHQAGATLAKTLPAPSHQIRGPSVCQPVPALHRQGGEAIGHNRSPQSAVGDGHGRCQRTGRVDFVVDRYLDAEGFQMVT